VWSADDGRSEGILTKSGNKGAATDLDPVTSPGNLLNPRQEFDGVNYVANKTPPTTTCHPRRVAHGIRGLRKASGVVRLSDLRPPCQ